MRKKLAESLLLAVFALCPRSWGQEPGTREKVREQVETNNPTLRARRLNMDEAKGNEITAIRRANPQMTVVFNQFTVGHEVIP